MKHAVFVIFVIFSLTGIAQQIDRSINVGIGYHILDFQPKNILNDGVFAHTSFQKKRFEIGLTAGFIKTKYYDINSGINKSKMFDNFLSLGCMINYNLLDKNRHKIALGFHVDRIFLLKHYYYNESGGFTTEITCSGNNCPTIPDYVSPYDFRIKYNWRLGINLKYSFRIWRELFIEPRLDFDFINTTYEIWYYGGYGKGWGYTFTPSLCLTYKLPLGKTVPE